MTPEEKAKALALARARLNLAKAKAGATAPPQSAAERGAALGLSSSPDGWRTEADVPGADPRSKLGAGLSGAHQGITLGWGDELLGGLRSLGGDNYDKAVAEERARVSAGQASHPVISGAGELAGALAVPLPRIPGASKLVGPLVKAGQKFAGDVAVPVAKTVLGRMAESGTGGLLAGLLSGAGHAQGAGEQQVEQTLGSGGIGAVVGAALPPAVAVGARTVAPLLRKTAERLAVRAVAPTPGLTNRLFSQLGLRTQADIDAFGRRLLDEGLVSFGGTPSSTLERARNVIQGEGGRIGDVLTKADELVASGATEAPSRHMQRIAVREAIGKAADTPVAKKEAEGALKHLLDRVGESPSMTNAEKPATFRELWKTKSQLQKALRPDTVSKLADEMYREGVSGYTRGVYNQLENAVGPDDIDAVREAARRFGVAKQAEKLLEQEVTRGAARSPVSLTDTQLGQVAGSTGIPLAGPVVTALSAALRSRAPAALSRTANAASSLRLPSGPISQYLSPSRALIDYLQALDEAKKQKEGTP